MRQRLADAVLVLRRAVAEARDDDVPMVAQALAFSLFLAIPALMLVVLGAFSLFADEQAVQSLIDRLGTVMPAEAANLLGESLQRSAQSKGSGVLMTVVGLGLALWTTTSAAATLMKSVTLAFGGTESRGFGRKRLLAVAIVGALVLAAALVVGLLVLGPHIERWVGNAVGAPSVTAWVWWTAQWPLLVAGLLFAFLVVLLLGPDVEQPGWRLVAPGALVAVVAWLAASSALALYSAHFSSYEKTWGTLAAVVVTLLWLWVTSAAILFGAEVNAEAQRLAAERAQTAPRPKEAARR
jgi:membrane protein